MNDGNWLTDFFGSYTAGSDSWDIRGKAEEVQEHAADAWLAELADQNRNLPVDELGGAPPPPPDAYAKDFISEIPSHFLWLETRDPSDLPAKLEAMVSATTRLDIELPHGIETLSNRLDDTDHFTGRTPHAFANFLNIAKDAAHAQSSFANELATAVTQMNKLLGAARDDVYSIADETINALDEIRDGGSGDGGAMAFAVAGAIVGVGAAVTGGTAAIAWALVSGVVGVTGTAVTSAGVSGDSVEDVLAQMNEAIADRCDKFVEQQDELVKGLNQDLGIADEYYRSLDPTRVKANTYEGEDDTKAVGDSLAVNLARTHAAATHAVPRLAEVFGKASESISSATGSGSLALGPAFQPWEELCNRLQRVTAITGNHLYEGGHNLAEATVEFARQDGINAKWVNETIEPVEHIEVPDVYTRPDPNLPPWMR